MSPPTIPLTHFLSKCCVCRFFGGAKKLNIIGMTSSEIRKIKRILEILAGGNRSKLVVFDSLIENYTEKYFGENLKKTCYQMI